MLAPMARVLTPQSEDFPRWDQEVVAKESGGANPANITYTVIDATV